MVQALNSLILLLPYYPNALLTRPQLFIKLRELQLQQGLSLLHLDELVPIAARHLLNLKLMGLFLLTKAQ